MREIVLSVLPGITDSAAIEFKDESDILGKAEDPEREHIEKILTIKIAYYQNISVTARCVWMFV